MPSPNTDTTVGFDEGVWRLNADEARLVAGLLLYRMPQDTRGILASQFPHVYNKICGREVMAVAWRLDGAEATPRGGHAQPILVDGAKSRE